MNGKNGIQFVIEKKPNDLSLNERNKYGFILDSFKNLRADETLKFPCHEGQEKKIRSFGQYMRHMIMKKHKTRAGISMKNGFLYLYKRGI